ncbi:MAG: helix-turn-helix domain-containing protein [Burkholderiaceae bacterium]
MLKRAAIRSFVAVVRLMSITLTEKDLYLTQSAANHQIQSLEEHLGTPLNQKSQHRFIC